MGYVGMFARRTAFVDDLIVFAIFLAVSSPFVTKLVLSEGMV